MVQFLGRIRLAIYCTIAVVVANVGMQYYAGNENSDIEQTIKVDFRKADLLVLVDDGAIKEEQHDDLPPLPACLRARNDTIPPSMYGKLALPIINLGEPSIFDDVFYCTLHGR